MKARPILFSAPMVRALLDGTKTQTRRVVKPPRKWAAQFPICAPEMMAADHDVWWHGEETEKVGVALTCPYGQPGDMLWVREAHYRFGHWEPVPGVETATGRQKWRFVADTDELRFDEAATFRGGRHHKDPETPAWHLRLARFMPRTASRLALEITDVRVERLRSISEADAEAEGLFKWEETGPGIETLPCWGWQPARDDVGFTSPVFAYRALWNHINGPDSWAANPWVWAVSFAVHQANVDAVLAQRSAA